MFGVWLGGGGFCYVDVDAFVILTASTHSKPNKVYFDNKIYKVQNKLITIRLKTEVVCV